MNPTVNLSSVTFGSVSYKGLSTQANKTRILETKSKDKFCHVLPSFVLSVASALRVSKLSNSVSTWPVQKISQHSLAMDSTSNNISRIYPKSWFYNPLVLQQKKIFASLVNWFHFNYKLFVTFTTNAQQVYHSSFYLIDFVQLLLRTNFDGGVFEDLSASAQICHVMANHPHL